MTLVERTPMQKTNGAPHDEATSVSPWAPLVRPVPGEWYTTAPARRRWLLRDARREDRAGVFPLGKAGQLIAAGGVGKTMVLSQLAVAVTTAVPWLETFEIGEPGRVVLLLGEEDADEVHRRLYAASRGVKAPEKGAIVVLPLAGFACEMLEHDACGNATETEFLRWLRGFVGEERDVRLLVVDPMSRFAGADAEKDNAQGTRFVQAIESLSTPDRSVLTSHHTNKTSRGHGAEVDGTAGRGSSSLHDGFRWQVSLGIEDLKHEDPAVAERLGEVVTLKVTKSNYSRKAPPLLLRRSLDGGVLVPLDAADAALVAMAKTGSSARKAKSDERAAERERAQAAKAEREAAAKAERERAREAEEAATRDAEDAALLEALAEENGLPEVRVEAALRARLGSCSAARARTAIARGRIAGRIVVRELGQSHAKRCFLPGTAPEDT